MSAIYMIKFHVQLFEFVTFGLDVENMHKNCDLVF